VTSIWPLERQYHKPYLFLPNSVKWAWGTKTFVMGIINATEDSFSGDGLKNRLEDAVALAKSFELAGVDVIDIGGASSRPGASATPIQVEIESVVTIIEAIRNQTSVPISVDTTWADVAEKAISAGANIVNDISGFQLDPEMANLVAERKVPAVIMHNQRNREHFDVVADVLKGLEKTLQICDNAHVDKGNLIFDPGFGFGWSVHQNLELLQRLPEFWGLKLPLLIGTSRKSSIGTILDNEVGERRFGTAATVAQAICAGVDVVRVHDAFEMSDVVAVTDAIVRRPITSES
jgi:dihydropteroate synthase